MHNSISDILATRIGRLAGRVGFGASLVARLLPENVGEATFSVAETPESLRARAADLLAQRGDLLGEHELVVAPDTLAAVVGAGRMALNPTVVTVTIERDQNQSSVVTVRAVAKEGLMKQRAGEEVAAWLRATLSSK